MCSPSGYEKDLLQAPRNAPQLSEGDVLHQTVRFRPANRPLLIKANCVVFFISLVSVIFGKVNPLCLIDLHSISIDAPDDLVWPQANLPDLKMICTFMPSLLINNSVPLQNWEIG